MQMTDRQYIAAPRASNTCCESPVTTAANAIIAVVSLESSLLRAMFGGKSAAAVALALMLPIGAAHLCCLGGGHVDAGLAHAAICSGSQVR